MHQSAWRSGIRVPSVLALSLLLSGAPISAGPDGVSHEAPSASELLPHGVREGSFHVVDEDVETDGFSHVFHIRSDFGNFRVRGGDVLLHRLGEIRALAFLLEWEADAEFVQAAERAGVLPSGGPPEVLAAFEASRRELAHLLGVDPYSDTEPLREALDRVAWVVRSGGLALPASEPSSGRAHGANSRVHALLRDHAEADLERLNRIELAVMGVPEEMREAFLDHPEYSAHHETALVDALAAMEDTGARHDFIEAALAAESRMEAHRYRRAAEMMRDYHEQTASLLRIEITEGHPVARTIDGMLVAPVRSDHATWTPQVERFAERLKDAEERGRDDADGNSRVAEESFPKEAEGGVHILFEGSLSEDARMKLEEMGHRVDARGAPWGRPASSLPDASDGPR